MPLRPNMEIGDYLDILKRRKWLILFSFLIIMFGASVYSVITPEEYKSTTTILLIPQRVPENYVRSTVSARLEDRLATIQQEMFSRTRLMKVIEELGLYKEERKKMPTEELVASMRKRIELQVRSESGSRGNDAITLSFFHPNPQVAMLAASRLASLFIDENLKTREQQAVGTSEFLDSQLQKTKTRLMQQEEKVKKYKMSFMGELPQQMDANLNILRGLQERLRANSEAIRSAGDRRVFLEAQISALERPVKSVVREGGQVEQIVVQDPNQALLAALNAKKSQLADLESKYTDRYPEVQKVRREVEQLERKIVEARQTDSSTAAPGGRNTISSSRPLSGLDNRQTEELSRLKAQLAAADSEISSLKKEKEDINRTIYAVQEKVSRSPRREQEMIELTRDYENLKQSYDDLLKKKLEADISQNLEVRQKGEQFQILDPANLPQVPFKPDRKKILSLAFMAACIVGLGGAVAWEMLDPTLRGISDFKHFCELPILACIPVLQDSQYVRSKAVYKTAVIGGLVTYSLAVVVFIVLHAGKIRAIMKF